jgi:hypothetical protein
MKEIQVYSKEGYSLVPRGDNSKRVKIHGFFKIYSLLKGIQVCSNKWQGPLHRGGNHKNVNMGWGYLKIFFLLSCANFNQT